MRIIVPDIHFTVFRHFYNYCLNLILKIWILKKCGQASGDGDILNIFRIIGEDMAKRFSKNLNPRYNLFVSRMDGLVNKECLPTKDAAVGFWAFNNI